MNKTKLRRILLITLLFVYMGANFIMVSQLDLSEITTTTTKKSPSDVSSDTSSLTSMIEGESSEPAENGTDADDVISQGTNSQVTSQPSVAAVASKEYYCSPNGSDSNPGTKAKPFKTIECALATVGKFKAQVKSDMSIILMSGNYFLTQTLEIGAAMSLPNGKTLTIKADTNARPVINGGKEVKNWEKTTVNGISMYKAKVTGIKYGRGFYVDEVPMELATTPQDEDGRLTWLWNAKADGKDYNIIDLKTYNLSKIKNAKQLEVVWHCEWKTFIKRADKTEGTKTIYMREPDFSWAITPATVGKIDKDNPKYWYWFPDPRNPDSTLYLQNDVSLIDKPGEYCYDENEKYIYYYPKNGENPNQKECIVSNLDTIMKVSGDLGFKKVENITFNGITIGYGGFDLLGDHGMATEQAQHYFAGPTEELHDNGDDRNVVMNIPSNFYKGNVLVEAARNVNFLNCDFINTGKALHFDKGVENSTINGCFFKDMGDSAVVIGNGWNAYDKGSNITTNIKVTNNVIRRVGQLHHSVPAISAYYANKSTISHNDIYDVPSMGISFGWGWYVTLNSDYNNNNKIEYNKIGRFLQRVRDGGGIYTLGQCPDSFVRYNYLYEQGAPYGGLYHDEGSSGYTTEWNVVNNNQHLLETGLTWLCLNGFAVKPGSKQMTVYDITIRDNFTTNSRIINKGDKTVRLTPPTMISEDQSKWPQKAKDIANGAGVEQAYKGLVSKYK